MSQDDPRPQGAPPWPEVRTRALKHRLEVEAARAWWRLGTLEALTPGERVERAFRERWFGARSPERAATLLQTCAERFLPWPRALQTLRHAPPRDLRDATLVCHAHTMLADPLYRELAGVFIPPRRASGQPWIAQHHVLAWLQPRFAHRWTPSTLDRLATGLLSTAREAGLCAPHLDAPPRHERLLTPSTSDHALRYLLLLLRDADALHPLDANPWLASLGLGGDLLAARLLLLPGCRLDDPHDPDTLQLDDTPLDWSEAP